MKGKKKIFGLNYLDDQEVYAGRVDLVTMQSTYDLTRAKDPGGFSQMDQHMDGDN